MADDQLTLVLTHQDDAGPGNLVRWLDERTMRWQMVEPEHLPAPGRYRALVILGSRESVFDETVPWIGPEIEFVRRCIGAGTPVFGLCFGAQVLTVAEGGAVVRGHLPEYGWLDVDGEEPFGGSWFSWHQDHIEPPAHARILATTSVCVHAFSIGQHIGVQYHPEITGGQIADWMAQERRVARLQAAGTSVVEVLERTDINAQAATSAAHRLYATFFDSLET